MLIPDELLQRDTATQDATIPAMPGPPVQRLLQRAYGVEFAFLDGHTGDVLSAAGGSPRVDWAAWSVLCREVARRGRPEFVADEDPFLVLALPLPDAKGDCQIAVGIFVMRRLRPDEDLSGPAAALGMNGEEAAAWAYSQPTWPAEALRRMSDLVLAQAASAQRIEELEAEAGSLSVNLSSTYEEISLLYRLTQNLKLSESDEELARVALEWLEEVLPAAALGIQLTPVAGADESLEHVARSQPLLLTHGSWPLDAAQFDRLIEHVGGAPAGQPLVVNRPITDQAEWPCHDVRQMIAVPLVEGENHFGWLVALNHVAGEEFGTVEANLLNSVAAILGIHSGNIELYRQQSELLAGVVRALTSAIDAKDPYTCGHSDRVARVAVCLAHELNLDASTLNAMYLSGLLHDVGKIGIDDSVLRKPGKLSEAEYEHIKRHVEIGHKILRDLKKLEHVLPVVLHHHESWDGAGYPARLATDHIPLSARIVAVADSFDAMGSDRPYRKRMPDEKIDEIFRCGAGQQWDPRVVEAFFRARDEIRRIAHADEEHATRELQPRD